RSLPPTGGPVAPLHAAGPWAVGLGGDGHDRPDRAATAHRRGHLHGEHRAAWDRHVPLPHHGKWRAAGARQLHGGPLSGPVANRQTSPHTFGAVEISVVIITLNEERNLARCITSVKQVADEVIVVDSGSRDATLRIAHEHGARVVHRDWTNYGDQKNFANGLATGRYILSLDADEA